MRALAKIREIINPPYSARDLLIILGTLVILIAIPLTGSLSWQHPSFTPQAASQAVTFQVNTSADDAYQSFSGGGAEISLPYIMMNSNQLSSLRYTGGFRFTNVNIPKGSTINSASLELYVWAFGYDNPNVTIFANNVDSAKDFATENLVARARTNNSVSWVAPNIGSGYKSSPDLKNVIQEVINRPGWQPGGAIAVLVDGNANFYRLFWARAYEYTAGKAPAKLTINYTPPSPPTVTLKANGFTGSTTIAYNTSAQLSWTSTGASSCVASGAWSGSKPTSGSASTGNLTSNQTYTLTCSGLGGSSSSSVSVIVAPPGKVTADIKANGSNGPVTIAKGSSVKISWSSTEATSCLVSPGGWSGTSGSALTGALTSDQTYTLNCSGPGGKAVDSVVVKVSPRGPTPSGNGEAGKESESGVAILETLELDLSVPYLMGTIWLRVEVGDTFGWVKVGPEEGLPTLDLKKAKIPLNTPTEILITSEKTLSKKIEFTPLKATERVSVGDLTLGDLNQDNSIDSEDREMLIASIADQTSKGDLNADGVANSIDWSIILTSFREEVPPAPKRIAEGKQKANNLLIALGVFLPFFALASFLAYRWGKRQKPPIIGKLLWQTFAQELKYLKAKAKVSFAQLKRR